MMSKLQLAADVTRDLAREFLAVIFRTGPTGSTSVTCGDEDSLLTPFHLGFGGDGKCDGVDWIVLGVLIVLVHAVSWLPRIWMYEPLANARMNGSKHWDEEEAKRFSQTATSLLFFTSSAFFVWQVLTPQEWLYRSKGWYDQKYAHRIQPEFKFYYLLYAARFLSDIISIFFESRKKEAFIAAFVHHVATISLVLGSALIDQTGYGGIIMFFFDWADIPLLSAKLCKYLSKDPNDVFQFMANKLFVAFALCFFATRNLFFNYVVVVGSMDNWDGIKTGARALFTQGTTNGEFVMLSLLTILAVLQTYWFGLILKAVEQQKKSDGNVEDIREKKNE